MSNFNYNKYSEIIKKISCAVNILIEANEDNYMSFEVKDKRSSLPGQV